MDSRIIPVIPDCVCALIHVAKGKAVVDASFVHANTAGTII